MGKADAKAKIPNPSDMLSAPPILSPMAKTRGTVTGPVVTPPLSHEIAVNSSSLKIESIINRI